MFKESQTQRPGGTIRVTSLNCWKPNYEAFLPSTFCTEPAEYDEGDQGHCVGSKWAGRGSGWTVDFFSDQRLKWYHKLQEGSRISQQQYTDTNPATSTWCLPERGTLSSCQPPVGTESAPFNKLIPICGCCHVHPCPSPTVSPWCQWHLQLLSLQPPKGVKI